MSALDHHHIEGPDALTDVDLRAHLRAEHGVQPSGNPSADRATHRNDHTVARRRLAQEYERAQIGYGHINITLIKCVRCRALLQDTTADRAGHDEFHFRIGDAAGTADDPAQAADW